MRPAAAALALAALAPAAARADDATASAGLGAGAVDRAAVAALDLGIDLRGRRWSLGVGARLRFADDGLRAADWDERSEAARIVRYAEAADRIAGADVALAFGELGGLALGRGLAVAGYGTGVDADHGRLGAWGRVVGERLGVEVALDDVVAPRIGAGRVAWSDGRRALGGTVAIDGALPDAAAGAPMAATTWAGVVAVDGGWTFGDAGVRGGPFAELALQLGPASAVGAVVGAEGALALEDGGELGVRIGGLAASDRYVPGWFGPLYEVERRAVAGDAMARPLGRRAAAGGLAGVGVLGEVAARDPEVGELRAGYLTRPGLADVATVRAALPAYRSAQAALSAAIALRGDAIAGAALAAELRIRLPGRLYAVGELSRLYYERDGGLAPGVAGMLSVGAVVGDGDPAIGR